MQMRCHYTHITYFVHHLCCVHAAHTLERDVIWILRLTIGRLAAQFSRAECQFVDYLSFIYYFWFFFVFQFWIRIMAMCLHVRRTFESKSNADSHEQPTCHGMPFCHYYYHRRRRRRKAYLGWDNYDDDAVAFDDDSMRLSQTHTRVLHSHAPACTRATMHFNVNQSDFRSTCASQTRSDGTRVYCTYEHGAMCCNCFSFAHQFVSS